MSTEAIQEVEFSENSHVNFTTPMPLFLLVRDFQCRRAMWIGMAC